MQTWTCPGRHIGETRRRHQFERECRISCSNDEYRKQNKGSTKHATLPFGQYFAATIF